MKKNGFTLIESTIGLSLSAIAIGGFLTYQNKELKKDNTERFINESYEIIKSVDHRIAIDGYNPSLWTKTSWINESEIVNDLIAKNLVSSNSSNCSGGEWNPSLEAEKKTKLITCNLWKTRDKNGEILKAKLSLDGAGFIKGFNLDINYSDSSDFKKSFMNIREAMTKKKMEKKQELTGSHNISFVSKTNGLDLTSKDCISNIDDCSIRLSLDRNGGDEYLRADGGNSMIGTHLTFLESNGQSPMKCLRWKKDNSNVWHSKIDEECGVGIYKELNHPAVVDVVVENGTFKNVLLNKDCNVFELDGANGIKKQMNGSNEVKSPCGILVDTGEIIQVVNNIHSSNIYSEVGSFNVAKAKALMSDSTSTNTLKVSELAELNDVKVDGFLTVTTEATFNKEAYFNENVKITKDLSLDNTYAKTTIKAPVGEFDNINNQIKDLKNKLNELNSSITSGWSITNWTTCSKTCGGGIQTRDVYCKNNTICVGEMPSSSQSCNTHACKEECEGGYGRCDRKDK